jgi:hypothetical protein
MEKKREERKEERGIVWDEREREARIRIELKDFFFSPKVSLSPTKLTFHPSVNSSQLLLPLFQIVTEVTTTLSRVKTKETPRHLAESQLAKRQLSNL